MEIKTTSRLIDEIGVSALARACEVNPQAVSQWKRNGIPRARMMFLEFRFPETFGNKTDTKAA
jgi:hypothetical protein